MSRKIIKKILLSVAFSALLFAGLHAKRRYFDPKLRLNTAAEQIATLAGKNEIRDGDMIFQTSLSKQSQAMQLATLSIYCYCCLIIQ